MTEEVRRVEIKNRVDSDYHLVMIWMKEGGCGRGGKVRKSERMCRGIWNEGREGIRLKLGRVEISEAEV